MPAESSQMVTPSPIAFSHDGYLLTIREFELFREAQVKLEDERKLRMEDARLSMERLIENKLSSLESKMEARFTATDKALALSTMETLKHLEALNGEQGRLASDRERFLSRETYEVAQKEFGIWRDTINSALALGSGRDRGIGLSWGVVMGGVGVLVAVISIVLALIRKT